MRGMPTVKIILLSALFLCACTTLVLLLLCPPETGGREPDYYIARGFDFANGRFVIRKEGNGNAASGITVTYCGDSAFQDLYRKYGLGYGIPMIRYSAVTGYSRNFLIRAVKNPNGKRKWFFFRDIPCIAGDAYNPVLDLLRFIQRNELSPAEVRRMYEGCVRRFWSDGELNAYVRDCIRGGCGGTAKDR